MALTDSAADTATANAAPIAHAYEAFARGDIPAVLALYAETITW
jgi:ketosteroid isomerase-like protein